MKIREYIARFKYHDSVKLLEKKIHLLMDGTNFSSRSLNLILGHLGYLDEEVICYGHTCSECPYNIPIAKGVCSTAASDYVRTLINRNRNPLEDML